MKRLSVVLAIMAIFVVVFPATISAAKSGGGSIHTRYSYQGDIDVNGDYIVDYHFWYSAYPTREAYPGMGGWLQYVYYQRLSTEPYYYSGHEDRINGVEYIDEFMPPENPDFDFPYPLPER